MSITFTLAVAQVDGSDFVKSDETFDGTPNIYMRNETSLATTNGTHLGDGVYSFASIDSGDYTVWSDSGPTQLTKFGTIRIGEAGAVLTTGNQTIGGAKTFSAVATFSSQSVFTNGLKADTIAENTSASGVTIDGILLKDDLTTSNIVNLNGTQTISAVKTFSALPESSVAPTTANQFTNKTYVDSSVASVSAVAYQQGTNVRRVISNATAISGKVYTSAALALASISSPSATNRFIVELENGVSDANYYNIHYVDHADLQDYVTITGLSRNGTHVLLGTTSESASETQIVNFENMSIYLSTAISGARTYASMKFSNCNIYAAEDVTFNNCILDNCFIGQETTSDTTTLAGTTEARFCTFTQAVTLGGGCIMTGSVDAQNTSYTLPSMPSVGS